MRDKTEEELIARARQDHEAFGLLYEKYFQPIFGYVLRRTANVALAEDITSQVFLKALKHLSKFRWKNVPFSAWLFKIATNEINSYYRKKKRLQYISLGEIKELRSNIDLLEEVCQAEKELQRKREFLEVHQKISQLKPKYQTVIALRFFENKKIKEIAKILGKKEGTIKAQIHRALLQLRKLMEKETKK